MTVAHGHEEQAGLDLEVFNPRITCSQWSGQSLAFSILLYVSCSNHKPPMRQKWKNDEAL